MLSPEEEPYFDLRSTSEYWIHPDQVFDGDTLRAEIALQFINGTLCALRSAYDMPASGVPIWRVPGTLTPGFVDLQVNGGAGVTFNNSPTVATLERIGKMLCSRGTTAWLPTFITDTPEQMTLAAHAIEDAYGQHGVIGVHFEGPHISNARRGTHKADLIRPLSEHTFNIIGRLRSQNIPVLLTLAPENQPDGGISRLCNLGVRVSIGHTAASSVQVWQALDEGASGFTHLFNGMTPMSSREPGVVGAALDSDAWCGFIADGHHVADSVLRTAIRARPRANRMVLVSDAMATLGGPPQFEIYGETIFVTDGKLVNREGSLAGAHIDLAESVHRLINEVGIDPSQTLRMATRNPAEWMQQPTSVGVLLPGKQQPMLLLDAQWSLKAVLGDVGGF